MPVGRADGTPGCPNFCSTILFAFLRYYYIMTEEERERLLDALERWEEKYCQSGETERVDEPTPSGGDYSVAYYYDKDHRPCKKKDAYFVKIVEYKADGTSINSTLAFLQQDN